MLFPLIYAFFPAVYSTAVIPISIFVRLGLVAMFVTKKQLWENQEFIDPACQMKIPNAVSAVKQFCNKNTTLEVADLEVLDKIYITLNTNKPSYPQHPNLP